MQIHNLNNPSAGLLDPQTTHLNPVDSSSQSTLKDLKKDKKFKLANKDAKQKKAVDDALRLASKLEIDENSLGEI